MSQLTDDQDKRRHHRVLFETPVMIHINAEDVRATAIDLSLKGVLIERPENWTAKIGDTGVMKMLLSDNTTHIDMDIKVAHEEHDHVGFHCEHIDIDSITHLRRLVELNLGDPDLLERELAALQK